MRRLGLLGLFALTACVGTRDPLPYFEGAEDADVRLRGHGCLVWEDGPRAPLAALDVRTGESWTVRPVVSERTSYVHAGLDARGNLVSLDRIQERTLGIFLLGTDHALAVLSPDGTLRDIWRRDGDPISDHVVGHQIAANSDGSRAAFVSDYRGYHRGWGPLEVWDLRSGPGAPTGCEAIGRSDGGRAWSPDGPRLAFGSRARRDDSRLEAVVTSDLVEFRDSLEEKGWVACVFVLDVETHEMRLLCPGATPVVAEDGLSVLVHGGKPYPWFGDYGGDRPWRRVDVASGASVPVSLPGDWQGAIASLAGGLVIYRGLPTRGSEARYTESNSPLVGAKPMGTVKIADLVTGRVSTLIPFLDPRHHVSWSAFERSNAATSR